MINSFLVIFCSFWLIFCNFLQNERGERSWRVEGAEVRRKSPGPKARRRFSEHRSARSPPASLTSLILQKVAKYSAKKNKILTKNEFTHPTETPLCLWYAVFVPPHGKLNNGKINYFSLINMNFLYQNVFSWLTLLSLGNYPTIEILCESWFRCIRNHWNMASITGGIQFQSQSSVFFLHFYWYSRVNRESCSGTFLIVILLFFSNELLEMMVFHKNVKSSL